MNRQTDNSTTLIVGIAGASGSGKSYLADYIKNNFKRGSCIILSQDHYYRDQSDYSYKERQQINYDQPNTVDFTLLIEHVSQLRCRRTIHIPLYDFTVHVRKKETVTIHPADLVVVEGILIFSVPEILPLFDLKIYVDTPLDICFIRRLQRDIAARGRDVDSIIKQYQSTVRPMFLRYIYPNKKQADIVITGEEKNEEYYCSVIKKIETMLKG